METAFSRVSQLAAKAIAVRFLVQHLLHNWFHTARASNLPTFPVLENTLFPRNQWFGIMSNMANNSCSLQEKFKEKGNFAFLLFVHGKHFPWAQSLVCLWMHSWYRVRIPLMHCKIFQSKPGMWILCWQQIKVYSPKYHLASETYVKVRAAPSILQVVVVTQGLSVYFGKTLKSGLAQRCVENCSVTVSPTSSQVFTSLSDFVSLLLLSVCPLLCDSCSHCITSSAFCTSQL